MLSYLGSGLIKGVGEKTAAKIVARFGTGTLDILENHPERLLEVRGITENKLEDIRFSDIFWNEERIGSLMRKMDAVTVATGLVHLPALAAGQLKN